MQCTCICHLVEFPLQANAAKINWNDITKAVPAFLTIILMPLTYSIAYGEHFQIQVLPVRLPNLKTSREHSIIVFETQSLPRFASFQLRKDRTVWLSALRQKLKEIGTHLQMLS